MEAFLSLLLQVILQFKKKVDEHALPSIKNVSESLRGLNKQAIDRNAVGRVDGKVGDDGQ